VQGCRAVRDEGQEVVLHVLLFVVLAYALVKNEHLFPPGFIR